MKVRSLVDLLVKEEEQSAHEMRRTLVQRRAGIVRGTMENDALMHVYDILTRHHDHQELWIERMYFTDCLYYSVGPYLPKRPS